VKTVKVRELQRGLRTHLASAQEDGVVVTRHGRPVAVILGVEHLDWEDIVLATDPEFWRTIERRRQQPTVPLDEAERLLG